MPFDPTIVNYAPAGSNAPRVALVTGPAAEPVSLAELRLWLKIDDDIDTDDPKIQALELMARGVFESITGRSLVTAVWLASWDRWPRCGTYAGAALSRELELPRAPLIAVSPGEDEDPLAVISVKYLDEAGDEQTLSADDYTVESSPGTNQFPRLWINEGVDLPTLGSFPGALRVKFNAGYGAAADVPEAIKTCIKLLVTHLYELPGPVNIGNLVTEIPFTLKMLIEMHQIRTIAG